MCRIILRWIFGKWVVWTLAGSIWHRIEQLLGACENGNELAGYIKCGELLDKLRTGWLLKKVTAPWGK
jgi:hypothetical protein